MIVATTALVVVGVGTASANADPSPVSTTGTGNARNQPIVGNFTLDTHPDTAYLGHDAVSCTVKVDRVYNFNLTSTKWYRYWIPGLTNYKLCPDMGVAVPTGRQWTADDLVVTWFIAPPGVTANAYVLRDYQVLEPIQGAGGFPSFIGTGADFNGDGQQDIWTTSDEGDGFRIFYRSGDTFVPSSANPFVLDDSASMPIFAKLSGGPGTDIIVDYDHLTFGPTGGHGVLFINGTTGEKQVLVTSGTLGSYPQYTASVVDHNGDGINDIEVTTKDYVEVTPSDYELQSTDSYYLNDGAGHFTLAP